LLNKTFGEVREVIAFVTVAALALALGLFAVAVYNRMVRMRNLVDEGWSGIDVQLKRRGDLVENLVETVKGYATHEKELFTQVTEARAAATRAGTVQERAQAENALTQTLRSLFAVAENYPELKASENFLNLQNTLSQLENEIQMARRYYNGSVRDYNTTIQVFPNSLLAGAFGFGPREYFEADEQDRTLPRVEF
jgi:LemA protein